MTFDRFHWKVLAALGLFLFTMCIALAARQDIQQLRFLWLTVGMGCAYGAGEAFKRGRGSRCAS